MFYWFCMVNIALQQQFVAQLLNTNIVWSNLIEVKSFHTKRPIQCVTNNPCLTCCIVRTLIYIIITIIHHQTTTCTYYAWLYFCVSRPPTHWSVSLYMDHSSWIPLICGHALRCCWRIRLFISISIISISIISISIFNFGRT